MLEQFVYGVFFAFFLSVKSAGRPAAPAFGHRTPEKLMNSKSVYIFSLWLQHAELAERVACQQYTTTHLSVRD